jgi:DNA (cytosine-5)-methyltransferase 1
MELNIPRGKNMFRVVETFSGIGAQAKALERLGIDYEIANTCEWDINAIIAYCRIHKGGIDTSVCRDKTDEDIDLFLRNTTLSMDGKKPIAENAYRRLAPEFKRLLYAAICQTHNFVSITDVHGKDIPEDIDLFTYSFPCQDLSLCGAWHGNMSGISRDAHNRSGMLWEVERILKEMFAEGRRLPHFLVMENVTNILSQTHKADFDDWKSTLVKLGYENYIYRLNSKNFGVPQKRERAYMISVLCQGDPGKIKLTNQYFFENNLEVDLHAGDYTPRIFKLKDVLRLDYSNPRYREEADYSQPNDTPSRVKIFNENDLLFDGENINEIYVNTVTTKQDRNPNSGLIAYDNGIVGKSKWRYLTPRECFMLMGFDEKDYDAVVENNPEYKGNTKLLTNEKLIKMAGNSICVNVLEAIFKQLTEINSVVFSSGNKIVEYKNDELERNHA